MNAGSIMDAESKIYDASTMDDESAIDTESIMDAESKIYDASTMDDESAIDTESIMDGESLMDAVSTGDVESMMDSAMDIESTFNAESIIDAVATVDIESATAAESAMAAEPLMASESTMPSESSMATDSTMTSESTMASESAIAAESTMVAESDIDAVSTLDVESMLDTASAMETESTIDTESKIDSVDTVVIESATAPKPGMAAESTIAAESAMASTMDAQLRNLALDQDEGNNHEILSAGDQESHDNPPSKHNEQETPTPEKETWFRAHQIREPFISIPLNEEGDKVASNHLQKLVGEHVSKKNYLFGFRMGKYRWTQNYFQKRDMPSVKLQGPFLKEIMNRVYPIDAADAVDLAHPPDAQSTLPSMPDVTGKKKQDNKLPLVHSGIRFQNVHPHYFNSDLNGQSGSTRPPQAEKDVENDLPSIVSLHKELGTHDNRAKTRFISKAILKDLNKKHGDAHELVNYSMQCSSSYKYRGGYSPRMHPYISKYHWDECSESHLASMCDVARLNPQNKELPLVRSHMQLDTAHPPYSNLDVNGQSEPSRSLQAEKVIENDLPPLSALHDTSKKYGDIVDYSNVHTCCSNDVNQSDWDEVYDDEGPSNYEYYPSQHHLDGCSDSSDSTQSNYSNYDSCCSDDSTHWNDIYDDECPSNYCRNELETDTEAKHTLGIPTGVPCFTDEMNQSDLPESHLDSMHDVARLNPQNEELPLVRSRVQFDNAHPRYSISDMNGQSGPSRSLRAENVIENDFPSSALQDPSKKCGDAHELGNLSTSSYKSRSGYSDASESTIVDSSNVDTFCSKDVNQSDWDDTYDDEGPSNYYLSQHHWGGCWDSGESTQSDYSNYDSCCSDDSTQSDWNDIYDDEGPSNYYLSQHHWDGCSDSGDSTQSDDSNYDSCCSDDSIQLYSDDTSDCDDMSDSDGMSDCDDSPPNS